PGTSLPRAAGKVLGGWSVSKVTTIQSGQWITLIDTRGGAIYGMQGSTQLTSRAQMAPGATYAELVTPGGIESRLGASGGPGFINTQVLAPIPNAVTPNGTVTNGTGWGNSGIGTMEGPGQFNFDVTVAKNTRVGGVHEGHSCSFGRNSSEC